jgi:hypothetical protein
MEFKKYNSIENSYQDDFISSIIEQGFCLWSVFSPINLTSRLVKTTTSGKVVITN